MPETPQDVNLLDLKRDPRVVVRDHLDPDTVARYQEATDLPPVVAYRVDGALVLVDGFHRTQAALQRGDTTIQVQLHDGTLDEAIVAACLANVRHGKPLTIEERDAAIIKLYNLDKVTAGPAAGRAGGRIVEGWSEQRLADAFAISLPTVSDIVRAARVIRAVSDVVVPAKVARVIALAPESAWRDLAIKARNGELRTRMEVAAAAQITREQAGLKPAPASAHKVMADVAERWERERPLTPEQEAQHQHILAVMDSEEWFFMWTASANDFAQETTAWLAETTFTGRPDASLAEIQDAARAALAAAQRVLAALPQKVVQ